MIIGIDNIIDFLKVNNCTKWQLRTAPDKDAFIMKAHSDEGFEEAIRRLQDTLQLYAGEKLYLEAWEKEGQTKNWFRTWIKTNPQSSQQSTSGVAVISGLTPDEVDRRINEAVRKTQLEYRLAELEKENNELKKEYKDFEKEKNSLQNQLIQRITPYVGTLLGNFFPKVAVAGPIPGNETVPVDYEGPENVSFEQETGAIDEVRLASVLQRLFAVEPDLIEILEAVANKAEQNPAQWQQYKPMILGFLK